jgi:hypothetical protein
MKIKNFAIGIAIIILTISVVVYGVNTFYKQPEYNDFCPDVRTTQYIDNEVDCIANEGMWFEDGIPRIDNGKNVTGYCDRDYYCRQDYEDARESYSRNLFLIALPLGIAIIAFGALVFGLEAVGAGLMGGGIGVILWGVGGFWQFAQDWLKFLLSLIGLIVLIWLAYFLNKKFDKKGKRKKSR